MSRCRAGPGARACLTIAVLLLAGCGADTVGGSSGDVDGSGEDLASLPDKFPERADCIGFDPQRNPYFGDLHVHTAYSLDANVQGTRLTPAQAYQFARGERMGLPPYNEDGEPMRYRQLERPLDFAAVTDHAAMFGETRICTTPGMAGYNSPSCRFFRNQPDKAFIFFNFFYLGIPELSQTPLGNLPIISQFPVIGTDSESPRLPFCGIDGRRCLQAAKTVWQDIQAAAEAYYDRSVDCSFTTFIGYEWTKSPLSKNMHRNVIFATDEVPALPPAYPEFQSPQDLWAALSRRCQEDEGCDYLTIPHNSNLSGGLMFKAVDENGDPYTAEVAATRQANEPLIEIYQHKGSSECIYLPGPAGAEDELCGFEILPYNTLAGNRFGGILSKPPQPKSFVRYALKKGLMLKQKLGVNPFKYGFIASTDTHLGTPGLVSEANYPGHGGAGGGASGEPGLTDKIEYSPGGLAVIWAEENTRESLFAAMERQEVYGTSGPRMVVRFYAGWDLPRNMCGSEHFAKLGYKYGVPMGGDLPPQPPGAGAPRFAISAMRDPAPTAEDLQRIQIIKGWIENGEMHERVYNVAGNPHNGAGVNLKTCETYGPGFAQLCTVWTDPHFDPSQPAFYYVRVVENPSCRWSHRQCIAAGVDCSDPKSVPEGYKACCNANYPDVIQERAWTSPIWYSPPADNASS